VVGSFVTQLDRVFLGLLGDPSAVAFYARGLSVVTMAQAITNSLSTVIIPRAAAYHDSDREKYLALVQRSLNGLVFIALPLTVGIACLSQEAMLFFGGPEFAAAHPVLILLASLVLFGSLRAWNYNQILIPLGAERAYLAIQFLMAAVFVPLDVLLVRRAGYLGAAVAIAAVQIVGFAVGDWVARARGVRAGVLNREVLKVLISSLLAGAAILSLRLVLAHPYLRGSAALVIGTLVYGSTLYALRSTLIMEAVRFATRRLGATGST
jgi:O-antigen/teichoic acid export membrane protein